MAAISPAQIVSAIEDAFTEAGASAALISEQRAHPRRFYVVAGESTFPVWVYIWTLTHGGGPARHRDEYRIQLTSVTPPLPQNPDGPTLLLGYEPGTKCFAGFDLRKHRVFSRKSPPFRSTSTHYETQSETALPSHEKAMTRLPSVFALTTFLPML
jgi:putative restriction endonuclease